MKPCSGLSIAAFITLNIPFGGCSWHADPTTTTHVPGFGEIMTLIESRHAKLWLAGQAQNWPLADYELEELREGLEDVGKFHPTHKTAPSPIPQLVASLMNPLANQLEASIKSRDPDRFRNSYDALTEGCNACHRATNFGFVVVTRPVFNAFPNQAFTAPP